MNIIHALILGIVEGVTEFLPISSTGHLILASRLLGIAQTDFVKSFEIIIQLGAIFAVIVLYAQALLKNPDICKKVLWGFVPTGVLGIFLHSIIKEKFLGNNAIVVWALFVGGIALIALELFMRNRKNALVEISYGSAFLIGASQALAFIPATTIAAGLLLGISRERVVEFSFFLAIPTMIAASGLELVSAPSLFTSGNFMALGVGFLTSFIVAVGAIKLFMRFIQKHSFVPFGIYRILIALAFLYLL